MGYVYGLIYLPLFDVSQVGFDLRVTVYSVNIFTFFLIVLFVLFYNKRKHILQDNVLHEGEQILHECQLFPSILLSHDSWPVLYRENKAGIYTLSFLFVHLYREFKYCYLPAFVV